MNLLTTILPELGRIESQPERRDVFTQALRKTGNNPRILVGVALLIGAQVLGILAADTLLELLSVSVNRWIEAVLHGVVCGSVSIVFLIPIRPALRRRIRMILRERGATICLGCGYDVRALAGDRCPECGERIGDAELD